MQREKPTLLFVQAEFEPFGGGNVVAVWMLQALRQAYDVTVLTWEPPDLPAINQAFGTSLAAGDFRWLHPSPLTRRLIGQIPDDSHIQRLSSLIRICKRIHHSFDILITADGEVDFGRPGIQYVHYPYLAQHYRNLPGLSPSSGLLRLRNRYGPWRAISTFSFKRMSRNLTLANSNWTAQVYRENYNAPAGVLYPPAPGSFADVPWGQRSDDLVCLSRLNGDKNHLRIIEIVRKLRFRKPHVQLHIAGAVDAKPRGQAYYRMLRRVVSENSDWVHLHSDLSREQLLQLLSRVRYGIHLKPDEHFGIAVAEMLRAGVAPFVHDSGGQVEIAGHPALVFPDDDHAVERIAAMMDQAELRHSVLAALQTRRVQFTTAQFCSELLEAVERWHQGVPESAAAPSGVNP